MRIHPGIRIDKIPVQGAAGLLFTAVVLLILLIGLPEVRWFLVFSVLVGGIVAVILRSIHRDRL